MDLMPSRETASSDCHILPCNRVYPLICHCYAALHGNLATPALHMTVTLDKKQHDKNPTAHTTYL